MTAAGKCRGEKGWRGSGRGVYGTAREQNVAVLERFPMESGIYVVWPSPADGNGQILMRLIFSENLWNLMGRIRFSEQLSSMVGGGLQNIACHLIPGVDFVGVFTMPAILQGMLHGCGTRGRIARMVVKDAFAVQVKKVR